ncbi:MAG TPA: lactate utilization protein [Candidatus Avacidaminococcus intestinavium]|uniref:Lactate utilization protein n=1 Tax=Candidatus Avacidaminococcus intestinavium TaxID=2840684 RepID=A0A9D1MPQ7_9FIRM|nr:lactate utilization protein [Candidatus Avacidaminococcus intestinavium]
MSSILERHYELIGRKAVDALRKNRFKAEFVKSSDEAIAAAMSLITKEDSIGLGGSMTVEGLGLEKLLSAQGNLLYNHQGLPPEEAYLVRRKQLTADVFLCSSNAVTLTGELINVDGAGNRVAAMTFGPKRVVVIVGANKIVKDEEDGRRRIKMTAAPMNTDRLKRKTPCVSIGYCVECDSPERICSLTSILHKAPMGSDFHVIVVGEALGY